MTHEPECPTTDGSMFCCCDVARAAYRRGYCDHARSRAYMEAVYGPYPKGQPGIVDTGDGVVELRGMRKV